MAYDRDEYSRYVGGKWFEGKPARPPEAWERERDKWSKSREFGNQFRDGMCQMLGRTQETGWTTENYYKSEAGKRFHDAAHHVVQHAMEFKAGRVGEDALKQLKKDARALRDGWTIEWFTVAGARIDSAVVDKMRELTQKFPGQFTVVEVTKEQFAQAIAIGKELAKNREAQQLQKARENEIARNLEAGKQLEAEKAELRKQVEEQARQLQEARERGRGVEVEPLRAAHAKMLGDLEKIREAEREQAREMLQAAGHTPQQIQAMETVLEQGREDQRKDVVLGIEAIAATVEREDQARAASEAAEQAREQERAAREAAEKERAEYLSRLQRQGIPGEVVKILGLGQAEAPSAAVRRDPDGQAPRVERGHGYGPERSRGINRDR
ncbi:hypothetical protein OHA40_23370 [Nocardia sp. NBC_00508]|uniref:hypothetical protein n=1 Tax=Nocardia sp. NBC_00508 TaxID=2975992 RepID=UPI002E81DB4C|nr:hypothetical protein [Nocardia sp. NBC_00508]WUD64610.1 hypothetical protein OHA40_23370 [Nocardia sp. NBC_00508]